MQSVPPQPLDHDAPLTLTTLGGAGLFTAAGTELLGSGKPLALLIYLACAPSRSVRREQLLTLLWADLPPEKARHALRQTLWFLRQLLGGERLRASGSELVLDGAFVLDRETFLLAIERRELEVAVACYPGNFLEGFAVPGGLDFEHWADIERQRLREAFLRSGEHLARQWMDHGRTREAVQLARRVRDAAPGVERAWRLLLESLSSAGDRLGAGMEAAALLKQLSADGREPEAATRALLDGESGVPATGGESGRSLNPGLVGREREFAAIVQAWDQAKKSGGRHIHLTAPPGLGKSRLLQEVHQRLRGVGARVVSLRANPGDHAIPFSFAGEIVRELVTLPGAAGVSPVTASALVALYPPLSGKFHAVPDLASGDDALLRRAAAIAELIEVVGDETPMALLLDDLHWADRQSRQLLLPLVARLGRTRLLLVSATRPAAELAGFGEGSVRLAPAPIGIPHIAELLGSLAQLPDEPWSRELPGVLREVTQGSPLLILEALQLSLDGGLLELVDQNWRSRDPAALLRQLRAGGALQNRIARLEPEVRWILLVLSTAGVPLSLPEIQAAARHGADLALPSLRTLEQAGMVLRIGETWQPIHDEIAGQAIAQAGESERRAAQSGLGLSLYTRPGGSTVDLARAGHHLAAAGERSTLSAAFVRYVRLMRQDGDRRRLGFLARQFLDGREESEVRDLIQTMGRLNRLRYSSGLKAAVGAAAVICIAAATLLGVAWWRRPELTLMIRVNRQQSNDPVYALPLSRSEWVADEPIRLDQLRQVGQPARLNRVLGWVPTRDGTAWYYVRSVDNEQTSDIFLKSDQEDSRPVAAYRHDDTGPAPSPDGTQVVFATSRYSPDITDDNYDLALRNLGTDSVVQLTSGPPMDQNPIYSPDGLRLGFSRNIGNTSTFCWMMPQPGQLAHCYGNGLVFVGWQDDGSIYAIRSQGGRRFLVSVDLLSGTTVLVRTDVIWASLSPDSRWIVYRSAGTESWMVAPTGDLASARPINTQQFPPDGVQMFWAPARRVLDPVQTIRISGTPDEIGLDVSYRLGLMARTAKGIERKVTASWISRDTSVASVDSTGLVEPLRAGLVTVVAKAGGFTDSIALRIASRPVRTLLREDWSHGLDGNWVAYGEPRPMIVAWPEGGFAFMNNGDGSYGSGVYLRHGWRGDKGLGMEASVRIPLNRLNWQKISLEFGAGLDSAAFGDWDHRTGGFPPLALPSKRRCAVAYPNYEGPGLDTALGAASGSEAGGTRVPRELGSGRIFVVRVQLFPDGRCGVALDGRPIWRSLGPIDMVPPVGIMLGYSSNGTKALIGPLEVWEGVKPDIDWNQLDPPSGTGGSKQH